MEKNEQYDQGLMEIINTYIVLRRYKMLIVGLTFFAFIVSLGYVFYSAYQTKAVDKKKEVYESKVSIFFVEGDEHSKFVSLSLRILNSSSFVDQINNEFNIRPQYLPNDLRAWKQREMILSDYVITASEAGQIVEIHYKNKSKDLAEKVLEGSLDILRKKLEIILNKKNPFIIIDGPAMKDADGSVTEMYGKEEEKKGKLLVIFITFAGFVLGLVLAFVLDLINSIKNNPEIKKRLEASYN